MKLNRKTLTILSIIYIYIPITIFLIGWVRWYIAIPTMAVIVYSVRKFVLDIKDENNTSTISLYTFLVALFAIMCIGYYAGWGRFVTQSGDWLKHNAVFTDLTRRTWPVYYHNDGEDSMLTYYIAQYLVPSVIGKLVLSTPISRLISAMRATEVTDYIWSVAGLLLVYLNLIRIFNIKEGVMRYVSIVLLASFSGPLMFAQHLLDALAPEFMVDTASYHWLYYGDKISLQYSNNFTLLRWTHPQVIAIWIILLLFYENRRKIEYYVFMVLPGMLFGAFPFVAMVFMISAYAVIVVSQAAMEHNFGKSLTKLFSDTNIMNAIFLGNVLILYFIGNVTGTKSQSVGFRRVPYVGKEWLIYVIFVSVMVLIYAAVLWKEYKNNGVFLISIIALCVIPLFRMGLYNDLVMRGSIPFLFMLMCFILEYINGLLEHTCNANRSKTTILIVCLIIGFIHPFGEIYEVMRDDDTKELGCDYGVDTLENYANRYAKISPDLKYNYYSYEVDKNIFCRYIAR